MLYSQRFLQSDPPNNLPQRVIPFLRATRQALGKATGADVHHRAVRLAAHLHSDFVGGMNEMYGLLDVLLLIVFKPRGAL